jgi:superfamily II DNA helicase RecQ
MATVKKFDEVINQILVNYKEGFVLRPFQREILEYVFVTGESAIVSAPTGAGKSAIFHLLGRLLVQRADARAVSSSSSSSPHVTLVLTPLNIIQADQINTLGQLGVTACRLDIGGHASCHQHTRQHPKMEASDESSSSDEDSDSHSATTVNKIS